ARQAARFEGEGNTRRDLIVSDLGRGRFSVAAEGETLELALAESPGGDTIRIEADGRVFGAAIAREPDALTVFLDGAAHRFADYSAMAHADEGAGGDRVAAPMPGLVKLVAVKAGAIVTKGEALIVLEAMKMEHTLKSPRDGTVAELLVAEGDQVEDGALLLALEPEAG
ncbi:MAG: biotin/lipoyl-containing protein, partial [Aurantimonas coralicida]|nr:biotin/lipoyl-containing protein [Aurantimonas coralicida]